MTNEEWIYILLGLIVIALITLRFVRASLRKEGNGFAKKLATWIKDVFDALFGMG